MKNEIYLIMFFIAINIMSKIKLYCIIIFNTLINPITFEYFQIHIMLPTFYYIFFNVELSIR